ncbi:MAG: type III-A CRISPR-associated RAMP protein Csm3 [Spirulina sp. DLM2.Bin59]|nr:MAG: type III-A CRISPR-associated RAMP protein Csm3 [Spirulina sp. DLM2.Bin59]
MTSYQNKPLLGKIKIKSTLLVETGLHIGGSSDGLNIGGVDKAVVRDPINEYPYLPGSSIKGKLRSILERVHNKRLNRKGSRDTYRYESDDLVSGFSKIDGQYIPFDGSKNCEVSRLFGSTGATCWIEKTVAICEKLIEENSDKEPRKIENLDCVEVSGRNHPARLTVRDAHLTEDSVKLLKKIDSQLYMTEWKFENGLDRITSAANPRQIERVPKGAEFDFEMVYTAEVVGHIVGDLKNLIVALAILEDDALGGHGSRGYGKVKFKDIKICRYPIDLYKTGQFDDAQLIQFQDIENCLKRFRILKANSKSLLILEGEE